MVWVRYDDEFHHHDKVMEARDADPGSLALHLLGNTWTASSKTPGWIPAYVPRQLVGVKAKRWAQVLVDARLWDVDELDGKAGWWVHDFETYNPVDEATKKRRSESARKAANARWHPGEDAPTDASRMPSASVAPAQNVPPDAIAGGHPVPGPVPQGSSLGGDRPEPLRSVAATEHTPNRPSDARCTAHVGVASPGPCNGCRAARERDERKADAAAEQDRRDAERRARDCTACDGVHVVNADSRPTRKICDHRRTA